MAAIMKPCIILSVAWFTCLGTDLLKGKLKKLLGKYQLTLKSVGETLAPKSIPSDLVINFDQTDVKIVPVSNWTPASKGQVLASHDNRCHHKIFRRCATAISNLQVPMIESKSPEDFSDPRSVVKKFCRKAHRSMSCVYNRLPDCEGHVKTDGVEDRAGMLSYVCGEGRKDLIEGSSCWLNNNVASRIRHCKAKHDIDNIATRAHDGNITDTYAYCGSLDSFVWACMGDWVMKRCPYNLSAFVIRALNPERLSAQLKC